VEEGRRARGIRSCFRPWQPCGMRQRGFWMGGLGAQEKQSAYLFKIIEQMLCSTKNEHEKKDAQLKEQGERREPEKKWF